MRPPLTLEQLQIIQSRNLKYQDGMTLLWEIKRLHKILRDVDGLRQVIDEAWKHEDLGQLTALYRLRLLLQEEVRNLPDRPRNGASNVRTDQTG